MDMEMYTDQLQRRLTIKFPPQRIVSLVPSLTELLFFLDLKEEIVGLTKFCIHPKEQFRVKERVGGTKQVKIEKIVSLQPDLIIANKEENEKSQIEQLAEKFPVWVSDISTLEEAYEAIICLGKICNRATRAKSLVTRLKADFDDLHFSNTIRVAYFIWRKPYMVAGGDTFIHQMLQSAGFENVFGHLKRYPEVHLSDKTLDKADAVFLSSEPYPFSEKHFREFAAFRPEQNVCLVDGELFSWYGSRLLKSAAYFKKLRMSFEK